VVRIGGRGDRRLLGCLVEPDRQGELGVRPVGILEADRRAGGTDRGHDRAEQRADRLVEVRSVDHRGDTRCEGLERSWAVGGL